MALTTIRNNGLASDAGGRYVLLSQDSTGASNVANLEVTLSQSTDYHHQILIINGYYNAGTVDTYIRMIESGSAVSSTGAYGWENIGRRNGTATDGSAQDSATFMRTQWYAAGNASGETSDLQVKIFNSNTTSLKTSTTGFTNGISGTGVMYSNYFNGIRNATTICEGLQISASSGNIYYSSYALYGVKL